MSLWCQKYRNFLDVENIIDLFAERYTKSEVTCQEYDTAVKGKAEPIGNVTEENVLDMR